MIFNEYKFWKYIYLNNYRPFSHAYKPSYSLINLNTIDTLDKFYILENHYNSDKFNLKQLPDSINKKFIIEEIVFFPIKLYEYTKIDK